VSDAIADVEPPPAAFLPRKGKQALDAVEDRCWWFGVGVRLEVGPPDVDPFRRTCPEVQPSAGSGCEEEDVVGLGAVAVAVGDALVVVG
jgi:hypothetical protein